MRRTPDVVIRALQPLPIPVTGEVQFLPVTLGHVLLLDRLDSPLLRGQKLASNDVFRAAFILSRPYAATLALLASGPANLDAAVAAFVTTAVRTVPGDVLAVLLHAQLLAATGPDREREFPTSQKKNKFDLDECRGLGWVLALTARLTVEVPGLATLCPGGDLWNLPVATAFVLTVADDIRAGAEFTGAPSYVAEDRLDREAAARKKPTNSGLSQNV